MHGMHAGHLANARTQPDTVLALSYTTAKLHLLLASTNQLSPTKALHCTHPKHCPHHRTGTPNLHPQSQLPHSQPPHSQLPHLPPPSSIHSSRSPLCTPPPPGTAAAIPASVQLPLCSRSCDVASCRFAERWRQLQQCVSWEQLGGGQPPRWPNCSCGRGARTIPSGGGEGATKNSAALMFRGASHLQGSSETKTASAAALVFLSAIH